MPDLGEALVADSSAVTFAAIETLREMGPTHMHRNPELQERHAASLAALQALAEAADEAVRYWNEEDEHSLDSAMLALDERLARVRAGTEGT